MDRAELARAWAEGARAGAWTISAGRGARAWAEGWDRGASCPAAPSADDCSPGGRGWRSWGGRGAEPARRERHRRRVQIQLELRRAGYLARHRWPVAREAEGAPPVYTAGPCAGLRAVDPWAEARHLGTCGARWLVHLRLTRGSLTPSPAPLPCGRGHLCPVCAADRAADYATAARAVLEDLQARGEVGALALVTLTQRADPGEPLQRALERLRGAWGEVRRPKRGAYQMGCAGAFWGYEVTWRKKRGWHAHLHAVIALRPGQAEADVRAGIGRAWRDASDAQRPGYGWRPEAGGCATVRARLQRPPLEALPVAQLRALCGGGHPTATRWAAGVRAASRMRRPELLAALRRSWVGHVRRHERRVVSWAGPWWRTLEDLEAVKQAAKYPTPAASLPGLALAEFVTVARGRRWHDGAGVLRGVLTRAAELQGGADGCAEAAEDAGPIVTRSAPGAVPDLDSVAPELGWRDPRPVAAPAADGPPPRWALAAAWAGAPEVEAAARAAGLHLVIGPAPGLAHPAAAGVGWRLAAAGEAPGGPVEALYLQGCARGLRAALEAQTLAVAQLPHVPRAVERRRPRGSAPRPPGWSTRGLPTAD